MGLKYKNKYSSQFFGNVEQIRAYIKHNDVDVPVSNLMKPYSILWSTITEFINFDTIEDLKESHPELFI